MISDKTTTTEYGYVHEDKVYLKAYLDFPDRQIGHVKESAEAAIQYFIKKFELASSKVKELEEMVQTAQNKGSYLMKLVHMRKYLANFDGLGDYVPLFQKLDMLEEHLRSLIAENRVKNLEVKQSFLQEGEDFIKSLDETHDYKMVGEQLKELKSKWIKTGAPLKDHEETLEKQFNELLDRFYQKRKDFFRDKAQEQKDRMRAYRIIVYKADHLKDSNDFEETFKAFKQFQTDWKNVGKINPKRLVEFWTRFKEINDYFFFRYKQFKTGSEVIVPYDPALPIRKEQALYCSQAEALVGHTDDASLEKAKQLLVVWKKFSTTGGRYLDKDLSAQFRLACDKIFEMAYLMKVIRRKYPDFDRKPFLDQFKIKMSFMKELIRKNDLEINTLEESQLLTQDSRTHLGTQKRKLEVKKKLLEEFEVGLNNVKNPKF